MNAIPLTNFEVNMRPLGFVSPKNLSDIDDERTGLCPACDAWGSKLSLGFGYYKNRLVMYEYCKACSNLTRIWYFD